MNGRATKGVQNRVQVILQNVGTLQQRFVCLQGEAVGQQIYRAGQHHAGVADGGGNRYHNGIQEQEGKNDQDDDVYPVKGRDAAVTPGRPFHGMCHNVSPLIKAARCFRQCA